MASKQRTTNSQSEKIKVKHFNVAQTKFHSDASSWGETEIHFYLFILVDQVYIFILKYCTHIEARVKQILYSKLISVVLVKPNII